MDDHRSTSLTRTGSARLPAQPCSPSVWNDPDLALRPAERSAIIAALTPCLALVGGATWTVEAKAEWFKAGAMALEGIPADLLARGAAHARMHADHPSKIVPLIIRQVQDQWDARKRVHAPRSAPEPKRIDPVYCTIEQAAEIMRETGADKIGLRADPVRSQSAVPLNTGERRAPTEAEMAIMVAEAKAKYPEAYNPPMPPAAPSMPGFYPDLCDDIESDLAEEFGLVASV